MAINVTTSKQQIQATVADEKITANVSSGFGAVGPSGVINVTAPITNAGTTTNANVGIAIGSGLSVSGGSLVVTPNTYATLVDGKIPSGQLPSYVDDVVEVASYGSLPSPGEQGKIYVITGTNKCYRWSGFVYVEIVASPGTTDSLTEGNVNLYHTTARAAAAAPVQSVNGQTGAVTISSTYTLPVATGSVLGGVKIGSGISIDGSGVISASSGYTLPTATDSVLGGVKIGSGVTITDGVISVSTAYAASSHSHGNITNDGKVGSSADKVLITAAAGEVTATSTLTFTHLASTSTYTNFNTTPGDLAGALSGIDSALSGKAAAADFDQALKTTSEPTFSVVKADGFKIGTTKWELSWAFSGSTLLFSHPSTGTEFKFKSDGSFVWPDGTSQSTAGAALSHAHNVGDLSLTATDVIVGRYSSGAGVGQEITCTAAGRAILDDATAADQRTTLGLGTAATSNTGDFATAGHTHAQLHDRSHSLTSTSDHTAGNWKVIYTDGSGHVQELALGDSGKALISNGASAAPSWGSAGSSSASDLTDGTLSDSRLSTNAQAAINVFLWSNFR